MTEKSKYEEQFERVSRLYKRFEEINSGKMKHNYNSENYQDVVYAFFINCHHMKDWLINDDSIRLTPTEKISKLKKFREENDCIEFCEDISNGLKHLKRNTTPLTGKQPEFEGRNFDLRIGPEGTTLGVKYNIITSKGIKDAFELATECIQKWEKFIDENIK